MVTKRTPVFRRRLAVVTRRARRLTERLTLSTVFKTFEGDPLLIGIMKVSVNGTCPLLVKEWRIGLLWRTRLVNDLLSVRAKYASTNGFRAKLELQVEEVTLQLIACRTAGFDGPRETRETFEHRVNLS